MLNGKSFYFQAWEDGKIYEALFPVEEVKTFGFHKLDIWSAAVDIAMLDTLIKRAFRTGEVLGSLIGCYFSSS